MPKPNPSSAARTTSTLVVASVGKAFRVLDAFRGGQRSLSLGEIATATGLDKSAAQRFAHTLHVVGYLAKDAVSRGYALTPKSLDIGLSYLLGNGVALPAAPYLREAARQSDETVNLTQLDGGEIVYIGRIPSRHIISNDVLVGTRFPAWCTATGRVMLAYMADDRRKALLARAERIRYTAHTVTSISQLQALISKARNDGYSFTAEQIFRGELTVAAPIFGSGDEPIAAISIAGPASRYDAVEFEKKMVAIVMEAAAAISTTQGRQHRLGGTSEIAM